MTKGKNRMFFNLEDETIQSLSSVAAKKGVPVSDVAEGYIRHGISRETELTTAERYNFRRRSMVMSLDSVLRLFGITGLEGGLGDKCVVLMALCKEKSLQEKSEIRNGIIEVSFFEVLNEIKDFDNALFQRIKVQMGKSGRIRERYFNLYPE